MISQSCFLAFDNIIHGNFRKTAWGSIRNEPVGNSNTHFAKHQTFCHYTWLVRNHKVTHGECRHNTFLWLNIIYIVIFSFMQSPHLSDILNNVRVAIWPVSLFDKQIHIQGSQCCDKIIFFSIVFPGRSIENRKVIFHMKFLTKFSNASQKILRRDQITFRISQLISATSWICVILAGTLRPEICPECPRDNANIKFIPAFKLPKVWPAVMSLCKVVQQYDWKPRIFRVAHMLAVDTYFSWLIEVFGKCYMVSAHACFVCYWF